MLVAELTHNPPTPTKRTITGRARKLRYTSQKNSRGVLMEEGESVLESICSSLDEGEDIEMLDVEEGELVEEKEEKEKEKSQSDLGQGSGGGDNLENLGSQSKNRKRKANKKRNKKRKSVPGSNVTDVNRFLLDVCRRLKEKKSYMVYTAVGCLGASALSELIKGVDAVQACGGQMTLDGRRPRTGGGILWNIIKAREPNAYKEIMKKIKEFEKQFKQQNVRHMSNQNKEGSSQKIASDVIPTSVPDDTELVPENQQRQTSDDGNRRSVHNRIRIPVSYDDLDDPKNNSV